MSSTSPRERVALYYDGLCRVCSREIEHYKGMRGADQIDFIDIAGAEFSPAAHGLAGRDVNRVMHARDQRGELHLGVDAFILIWSKLKALKWLSRLARHQPLNFALRAAYEGFVRVRPYLPRKPCPPSGACRLPNA